MTDLQSVSDATLASWINRAAPAANAMGGPRFNMGGTVAYTASSGLSQEMAAFWPAMTSGDSATLPNSRIALDRARDLVRNNPHAAAAVMRLVDMLIGDGLTLVATPDARALGVTRQQAREIGRALQTEWRLFWNSSRKLADARRQLTGAGIFRLAARTYVTCNEACAVMKWDGKQLGRYQTQIALVDPDRLYNYGNGPDTLKYRGGVEFDDRQTPVAYWIRQAHLADWWAPAQSMTWTRVPKETDWGRPVFIHAFEPEREDQSRAITPFAALMSSLRMIGKHADTELANATANALFTAFISTDAPTDEVAQRLAPGDRAANVKASWGPDRAIKYYGDNPVRLGGVRVPVLAPGTKFEMNNAPRQTAAFSQFQTTFLRAVASALGMSYEQLTMDWSQTNYSSARAALNEVWRSIKRLQAQFVEQFVQPVYLCFLEEAFDKGYVAAPAGAPDFWDMPEAWASAKWVGPGRGYVDALKEKQASALGMENMTSTLQDEAAEQGKDYEQVLDQIEREEEDLKDRKLTRLSLVAAVQSVKGPKPDSEDADGRAGPGGEDMNGSR